MGQHYQDPEGHVVCHISAVGGPLTYTASEIGSRLYKLMTEYGNIVSMTVMAELPSPAFLVAYYDTRAADKAVAQLDSQYVEVKSHPNPIHCLLLTLLAILHTHEYV